MSLTSELAEPDSAISRFLAAELPDVKSFATAFRQSRPVESEALRPTPPPEVRVQWGTLGAAIDHRLRFAFVDEPAVSEAVRLGILHTVSLVPHETSPAIGKAAAGLLALLGKTLDDARSTTRNELLPLRPDLEERLCRICYALSWFEETWRSGRLWPGTALGDADATLTLQSLLAAVPDYAVEDLCAQFELAGPALEQLRTGRETTPVRVGPTFAGSEDVGGADADLIIGNTLFETKALIPLSRKLGRSAYYQLIAYALLDYDDEYGIERLALYLSRYGRLYTWPIEEYLALLGCTVPIRDLRSRCAAALRVG